VSGSILSREQRRGSSHSRTSLSELASSDGSPKPLDLARGERPNGQGATVEEHGFWTRDLQGGKSSDLSALVTGAGGTVTRSSIGFTRTSSTHTVIGDVYQDQSKVSQLCLVKPGSAQHLAHAVCCLTVMLYDVVSLPMIVAFALEDMAELKSLNFAACAFWTYDIATNFRLGYNDQDRVEMRFHKIASRYMKTWFVFDIVVISFDWFTYVIEDMRGLGITRAMKTPRIVRVIFRTLRLLRVVKLVIVMEEAMSFVVSDWLNSTIGIVKMLFGMILFNHFVACFWYIVGDVTKEHSHGSWVSDFDQEHDPSPSVIHRYVTSFHWSMCQYTPAPNNIHPSNFPERLYACITLLFGIAVFSTFLGKITGLLTHMGGAAFEKSKNNQSMRVYMSSNMISLGTVKRINTFLKNRLEKRRMLSYSEVKNFEQLPESLAAELKYQSNRTCVCTHSLLCMMRKSDAVLENYDFLFRLCSSGLEEVSLKWGDELLHRGLPATTMVFVKNGVLEYSQKVTFENGADVPIAEEGPEWRTFLGKGTSTRWACEMALWCDWRYRGHLSAKDPSTVVLVLVASTFHDLVGASSQLFQDLKEYAAAYTLRLRTQFEDPEVAPTISDLWGQGAVSYALVDEVFNISALRGTQFMSKDTLRTIGSTGSAMSVVNRFGRLMSGPTIG